MNQSLARSLALAAWTFLLLVGLPVTLIRIVDWQPPNQPRWQPWLHQPHTPGLVSGPQATGKTTLAMALGRALGAPVSRVIR